MRYIGFDVGDGESAVAAFEQGSGIEPIILPVYGSKSILSAVGTLGGEIVVGERAYTDALADGLSVRFKSRFTYDASRNEDIVHFARGVVRHLQDSGAVKPEDRFVIGCPAGWNPTARARYKDLMTRAGIRDPQIISESRAAFLYAKYAKTVALDVDILNQSALVVDIGSSTLDFAYIVDGRETGVGTFGDIALGGGLMDAELLRLMVEKTREKDKIKAVFEESRSWYSYCEIQARQLKEEYFTRLPQDPDTTVKKQLRICYDGVQKLQLTLDKAIASNLIHNPLASLSGRSFHQAMEEALRDAVRLTDSQPPKLVLLTGGASRMPFIRELCRNIFANAAIVCCPEPEFSIAKGLSYAGWVDENLRAFRKAISEEITEERIAGIAKYAMPELQTEAVDALSQLLIDEAALPIVSDWRQGRLATLDDMNTRMQTRMEQVLVSPMAREALAPCMEKWLKGLGGKLQALIDPICDRYEVPRKEMQLNLTAAGASTLSLKPRELTANHFVGTVLTIVVSVATGLLCGGSGVALVASGPLGFLVGLVVGALISLLGTDFISKSITKANIPLLLRSKALEKRLASDSTRKKIRDALDKELGDENGQFQQQVVSGFSRSFKSYVTAIAQAAEIPIE